MCSADPLVGSLVPGAEVGMLGLELHTRRRNRLNGVIASVSTPGARAAGSHTADASAPHGADLQVVIDVSLSFGNCPKYIQGGLPLEERVSFFFSFILRFTRRVAGGCRGTQGGRSICYSLWGTTRTCCCRPLLQRPLTLMAIAWTCKCTRQPSQTSMCLLCAPCLHPAGRRLDIDWEALDQAAGAGTAGAGGADATDAGQRATRGGALLGQEQRRIVRQADTFFIAR